MVCLKFHARNISELTLSLIIFQSNYRSYIAVVDFHRVLNINFAYKTIMELLKLLLSHRLAVRAGEANFISPRYSSAHVISNRENSILQCGKLEEVDVWISKIFEWCYFRQ